MPLSNLDLFTVTEVELIYRHKRRKVERPKVKGSKDAFELLINAWDMNRIELLEEFKILLLDRNNCSLGISNISTGGVSSCLIDPKILFATAIKAKASGIILAHNHPSGNLNASTNDHALTKKLNEGGKILDISIHDHLIVTPYGYYSMADEGVMPCL